MRSMGKVNTVIIGGGLASNSLLAGFRRCKRLSLQGLVSTRQKRTCRELGITHYSSIDEVLNDPKIEAIVIAVPSYLHVDIALAALKKKKHILVEKPIDVCFNKARELVAESKLSNRIISYVSQFRFSPGIEQLKDIIANKVLGELISITGELSISRKAIYYQEAPWREDIKKSGGGILMMNGIHLIDVLIYLLGIPKVLSADFIYKDKTKLIENSAQVNFLFHKHILGSLSLTRDAQENYKTYLKFIGRKGCATLSEYKLNTVELTDGSSIKGRTSKNTAALFALQLDNFGSSIRNGSLLRTPIEDGLNTLGCIAEAYDVGNRWYV